MISVSELNSIKLLLGLVAKYVPGGITYGYIEGDTIAWIAKSDSFKLDLFKQGHKISEGSTTMQAMRENRVMVEKIPSTVYGHRLIIISMPVVNDEKKVIGAISVVFPKKHPVSEAFDIITPILVEMFQEGALFYLTDLKKFINRKASEQFDLPRLKIGYEMREDDVIYKVIQSRKPAIVELDEARYGLPVTIASYPLFDDENKNELLGTFGLLIPKVTAANLRKMADVLKNGLIDIAATIEELTASATEINANEQDLNESIKEIITISEQINEVSAFIKDIADETKLLGLNAAIEAARAGEAGRGFGVVAEEIRKLSDQSKSTVPKIKELTNNIIKMVNMAGNKSQSSLSSIEQQAAATEEITASIEEITALSAELADISQKV